VAVGSGLMVTSFEISLPVSSVRRIPEYGVERVISGAGAGYCLASLAQTTHG
jgi:hypothetical protein